jgi:hypothetical protein
MVVIPRLVGLVMVVGFDGHVVSLLIARAFAGFGIAVQLRAPSLMLSGQVPVGQPSAVSIAAARRLRSQCRYPF